MRCPLPIIHAATLAVALAVGVPCAAFAQATAPAVAAAEAEARRAEVIARVLASGDGVSAATAYRVDRVFDSHLVVLHLRLRLMRQHSETQGEAVLDTWRVRTPEGEERDVVFRAPAPDTLPPDQAETDRAIRGMLTSGDGLTPATAFVTGGAISAQYAILRLMGLRSQLQGLFDRDGCRYDMQRALDATTGTTREVWFRLGGSGALSYTGRCE